MKRKLISLFLVLSLVLGSFSMVFAAPADVVGTDYQEDVEKLMAIGVLSGYPDGTFKPENTVTRAEFAKMIVVASGLEDAAVLSAGATQFSDVAGDFWASGYINVATQKGFLKGYPDGTFGPANQITYAEAFTILIRAIGLGPVVEKEGVWPSNYLAKAVQLELNDGISKAGNAAAVRGDVAIAFVNTMTETVWEARSVNSDGTVDYGPSVAGDTMLSELGYTTLGSTAATDNVVLATQQYNALPGGLAADKIVTAVGLTDTLADSCTQDPDAFYGQEVTLWLDSDGDVVYIENETDEEDIIVDTIDEITTAGDLKLDNGEEYAFAVIDSYQNGANTGAAAIAAADFAQTSEVKIVLDGNGDIAYYALWNEDDSKATVTTAIVDAVGDDIEFFTAGTNDISDIEIEEWNDDIDDDVIQVEVIRNGEVASLEDIEAGDVVTQYNVGSYYKFVVTDDKVNGTLTKVQGTKLYIGTTSYSQNNDMIASLDNEDNVGVFGAVGFLAKDFVGENVKLYLDGMGQVAYILSDVEEMAENYAIVTSIISGKDATPATAPGTWSVVGGTTEAYLEVLNSEDETVVVKFENTSNSTTAYAVMANAGVNGFVKYELNSDGYVENAYVAGAMSANYVASAALASTAFDDSPAFVAIGGTNYYVTGETVIYVIDSSIAANDAMVYDDWDNIVSSVALAGNSAEVVYDSGNVIDYVVVDLVIATDVMYGMYVTDGVDEDGATVVMYTDGSEVTYGDMGGGLTAPAKGDFFSYRLSDDEIEETAPAAGKLFTHANITVGPAVNVVDTVDEGNNLLTVEAYNTTGPVPVASGTKTTYALEDDVVVYNLDDIDEPVMATLGDITTKYAVQLIDTDSTPDGEIDIIVMDKY